MYERSQFAVCISLGKTPDGRLLLVLDDVERQRTKPEQWRMFTFVTDAPVAEADLTTMNFTDEQFADFGRLVLGSLAVHVLP
jgi:hypothetical protein